MSKKKHIGELLLEYKLINNDDLKKALNYQSVMEF